MKIFALQLSRVLKDNSIEHSFFEELPKLIEIFHSSDFFRMKSTGEKFPFQLTSWCHGGELESKFSFTTQ